MILRTAEKEIKGRYTENGWRRQYLVGCMFISVPVDTEFYYDGIFCRDPVCF